MNVGWAKHAILCLLLKNIVCKKKYVGFIFKYVFFHWNGWLKNVLIRKEKGKLYIGIAKYYSFAHNEFQYRHIL